MKLEQYGLICDYWGYLRDDLPCKHEYAVAFRFGPDYKFAEFNESMIIKEAMGNVFDLPNLETLKKEISCYLK